MSLCICLNSLNDNTKSDPNANYGLCVIMTRQRGFVSCNKCTTLVGITGGGCAYVGAGVDGKTLNLPLNFAVSLKLLSKKILKKKSGQLHKVGKKKGCKSSVMAQKDVQFKFCLRGCGPIISWPGFYPDPFLGAMMVLQDAEDRVWEDLKGTSTYKVTKRLINRIFRLHVTWFYTFCFTF